MDDKIIKILYVEDDIDHVILISEFIRNWSSLLMA